MSETAAGRDRIALLLLVPLVGWVATRYARLEGPHAVVLLFALGAWLACFTLATLGFGAPVWRWISGEGLERPQGWLVSAACGALGLMAVAGALGTLGGLRGPVLLAVLGAGAILGAVRVRRSTPAISWGGLPALPVFVLAAGGVLTLLAVATPSAFYDQVHYHLAFPERWLRTGTIDVFPRHSYSYLPANMGLLYAYALAGPGVWAAQALHWWMGLLAVASAWFLALGIGGGSRAGAWGAAALVATPAVLLSSTWASADLGVAALGGVAFVLALEPTAAERARGPARYFLCGALCGAAFGCKYLALATVAVPVGLIIAGGALLAAREARRIGPALPVLAAWGLGMLAAVLPWSVRNVVLTGNPVYPFFGDAVAWLVGAEVLQRAGEATRIAPAETAAALPAILSLRTFRPLGEAGAIGPLWLMLLPLWLGLLAFGRRSRAGLLLALAVVAGIVCWSQFRQLGRYLLPVLVPAAAGVGLAVERTLAATSPRLRPWIAAMLGFVALWSLQGGLHEHTFQRIACTFGRMDTREFLRTNVSYWSALDLVNEELPEDAKLLLVGEPRALHLERDVVLEDPFGTPYLLELATTSASPEAMAGALSADGITHVLYNEHEADRIARMEHRPAYFAGSTGEAQLRLQAFLERCLEPTGAAGPVRIYRLDERCAARPPAAG